MPYQCKECGNFLKEASGGGFYCDFRECSLDGTIVAIKPKEFDPFAEYPREFKLPNGYYCTVIKTVVGSRQYISDEVGGGVTVWDTALVEDSTLLAVLAKEAQFAREDWNKHDAESLREQQRHAEEFSIASKPVRSEPEGMLHRIWQKIFPLG